MKGTEAIELEPPTRYESMGIQTRTVQVGSDWAVAAVSHQD